jgi:hypothetical protein
MRLQSSRTNSGNRTVADGDTGIAGAGQRDRDARARGRFQGLVATEFMRLIKNLWQWMKALAHWLIEFVTGVPKAKQPIPTAERLRHTLARRVGTQSFCIQRLTVEADLVACPMHKVLV